MIDHFSYLWFVTHIKYLCISIWNADFVIVMVKKGKVYPRPFNHSPDFNVCHFRALLAQDAPGDQGDQGLPLESQEEGRQERQDQEER